MPISCSWRIPARCRGWCRTRSSPCRPIRYRSKPDDVPLYLARCLFQMIVTAIGMVTVVFFLIRAIPGDPAPSMPGASAPAAAVAALQKQLGLALPIHEQYLHFLSRAVTGDLG